MEAKPRCTLNTEKQRQWVFQRGASLRVSGRASVIITVNRRRRRAAEQLSTAGVQADLEDGSFKVQSLSNAPASATLSLPAPPTSLTYSTHLRSQVLFGTCGQSSIVIVVCHVRESLVFFSGF